MEFEEVCGAKKKIVFQLEVYQHNYDVKCMSCNFTSPKKKESDKSVNYDRLGASSPEIRSLTDASTT